MNFKKAAIITVALLLIAAAILIYLRGEEDAWICVDNKWEKHGNPSQEMPVEGCGEPLAQQSVTNFEECATAGFAIMESYPRQCRDDKGTLFVEEITEIATTSTELATTTLNDSLDNASTSEENLSTSTADILLEYPLAEANVKSPLFIKGKAKGSWFFEASFPVVLTNWDGLIIAEGVAKAESDWMTEDFVPFSATLEFEADTSVSNRGALILKKDNPSGLPENDDALEITIFFE